MKLSKYASTIGVSYLAAYNMFKRGDLAHCAYQLPSGTIIVDETKAFPLDSPKVESSPTCAIYARVSSHDKKDDLARQLDRLRTFSAARGLQTVKELAKVESGMNDSRDSIKTLFAGEWTTIVVEHKDRLTRFGYGYLELLATASGKTILVINPAADDEADLMTDLVAVITGFCARLHGRRRKTRVQVEEFLGVECS